jgi:Uma2 family endonuclease
MRVGTGAQPLQPFHPLVLQRPIYKDGTDASQFVPSSRVLDSKIAIILVVEVVGSSTATADYRAKRIEYAVLNIPEYWIVDPIQYQVTACTLREGVYDDQVFHKNDLIFSLIFPSLSLTAAQVLRAD